MSASTDRSPAGAQDSDDDGGGDEAEAEAGDAQLPDLLRAVLKGGTSFACMHGPLTHTHSKHTTNTTQPLHIHNAHRGAHTTNAHTVVGLNGCLWMFTA